MAKKKTTKKKVKKKPARKKKATKKKAAKKKTAKKKAARKKKKAAGKKKKKAAKKKAAKKAAMVVRGDTTVLYNVDEEGNLILTQTVLSEECQQVENSQGIVRMCRGEVDNASGEAQSFDENDIECMIVRADGGGLVEADRVRYTVSETGKATLRCSSGFGGPKKRKRPPKRKKK